MIDIGVIEVVNDLIDSIVLASDEETAAFGLEAQEAQEAVMMELGVWFDMIVLAYGREIRKG
jgi:hypothetical protein